MKNLIIVLMVALLSGTACSGEKSNTEMNDVPKEEMPETALVEKVRPAAEGGTSGAYFTYTNELSEPDTVLSVSSSVAGMAEVHEMYENEGMMAMREMEGLVVQPGESLTFKPGGVHIMLMQLNQDLQKGDTVSVEIEFARAGTISKSIPVKID